MHHHPFFIHHRKTYRKLNMEFVPSCKVVKRIDATHLFGHKLACSFRNIGPMDEDLLIEVLCCLPPKSLMRCCCVCKPWHTLIYRYCVPRITPFLGCDIRIKKVSSNDVNDLIVGRAVIPESGEDVDVWPPVFNIHDPTIGSLGNEFPGDFSPGARYLLDSQDGLFLFLYPLEKKYILWNPNTKQFLFVPRSENPVNSVALAVEIRLWKPDREMDLFKIVSFRQARGTFWKTLDVFYSCSSTWSEHRVKYINNSNCGLVDFTTYHRHHRPLNKCAYGLNQRSIYLHRKIFILCYPHNLSWFEIRDNSVDVDFYSVDLPDSDRVHTKTMRTGCIGSCGGHIRLAQTDTATSSVQIWVFNVDTRKPNWTEMYRVSLKVLTKHPTLVHLRTVLFPAMRRILKVLALHPESDDGVIIWTPNLIFCYHLKSRNLVSLESSNVLNAVLQRMPMHGFAFTRCLVSLALA
ncbi:hypothetical protein V6N13_038968 [Hibiscus sabdariffa]